MVEPAEDVSEEAAEDKTETEPVAEEPATEEVRAKELSEEKTEIEKENGPLEDWTKKELWMNSRRRECPTKETNQRRRQPLKEYLNVTIAQPKSRPALSSPTPDLGARVGTNLLLLCTLSLSALAQVSHLLGQL